MKKPDVIDAEFEVIQPGTRPPPRNWLAIIPPQWRDWPWSARITYVVVLGAFFYLILMIKAWTFISITGRH